MAKNEHVTITRSEYNNNTAKQEITAVLDAEEYLSVLNHENFSEGSIAIIPGSPTKVYMNAPSGWVQMS